MSVHLFINVIVVKDCTLKDHIRNCELDWFSTPVSEKALILDCHAPEEEEIPTIDDLPTYEAHCAMCGHFLGETLDPGQFVFCSDDCKLEWELAWDDDDIWSHGDPPF